MNRAKRFIKRMICLVVGHRVNEGLYIDSHGGLDGVSYCERCGEYDV